MQLLMRIAAAGAAVIVVAGCGGSDGKDSATAQRDRAVSQVIDRLGQAARARDAKTICEDLFTINLQTSIRRAAGTSCAQEVGDNIFGADTRFRVQRLETSDTQAIAVVRDQQGRTSSLVLLPEAGAWHIARIGSAKDVQGS